jgi:hypothetical protein
MELSCHAKNKQSSYYLIFPNCHLKRSATQVRNCLQVFAVFESARGVLCALNDIVQAIKNRVCQSVIEIIHDIFKVISRRVRKGFHVFIPRSARPSYQQLKPGFGNLFVRNGVYFPRFEFHLVRPCRFSVLPVQTLNISRLPADAKRLARAIRSHWSIENRLYWCMDVAFADDQMRARTGHAAHNLALLKQITLNLTASIPHSAKAASKLADSSPLHRIPIALNSSA